MINTTNKYFLKLVKLFKEPELIMPLGRWCHINMPMCNNDVINKKIHFANIDNSMCNFKKKLSNNKKDI